MALNNGFKPVIATKVTPDQELFEVVITNELGERETFLTTAGHPFYVHEQGLVKSIFISIGDAFIR